MLWCLFWFWLDVLGFAFGLVGGVGVFGICALFDLGGNFSLWGLLVWFWFWCLECLVLFVLLFGCGFVLRGGLLADLVGCVCYKLV